MNHLTEEAVEQMALEQLQALGWQVAFGPDIGPDVEKILKDAQ